MPELKVKHSSAWKDVQQPYGKHSGAWKPAKEIWAKHSGAWKKIWPVLSSIPGSSTNIFDFREESKITDFANSVQIIKNSELVTIPNVTNRMTFVGVQFLDAGIPEVPRGPLQYKLKTASSYTNFNNTNSTTARYGPEHHTKRISYSRQSQMWWWKPPTGTEFNIKINYLTTQALQAQIANSSSQGTMSGWCSVMGITLQNVASVHSSHSKDGSSITIPGTIPANCVILFHVQRCVLPGFWPADEGWLVGTWLKSLYPPKDIGIPSGVTLLKKAILGEIAGYVKDQQLMAIDLNAGGKTNPTYSFPNGLQINAIVVRGG